jgi:hypothetical protein
MQSMDDIRGVQDASICHGIVAFADLGDPVFALQVFGYFLHEPAFQCVKIRKNLNIHMRGQVQGGWCRCMPKIVGLMKEQCWCCALTNDQPGVLANMLFGEPLNHQGVGSKSRTLIVVEMELLAARAEHNGAEPSAF